MVETARNVMAGSDRPLPKWNHLGETFSQGLSGAIIQLVYALPLIMISCVFACLGLLLALSGADVGDNQAIGGLLLLVFLCLLPLLALISLVVQPLTLGALARYTQTGSLGAALRVGAVVDLLRADLGGWLLLWLLQLLCGLVAGLGGVFFVIGAAVTAVYATAVFGHLLGQKLLGTSPPQL
jgi:hypothetical protein